MFCSLRRTVVVVLQLATVEWNVCFDVDLHRFKGATLTRFVVVPSDYVRRDLFLCSLSLCLCVFDLSVLAACFSALSPRMPCDGGGTVCPTLSQVRRTVRLIDCIVQSEDARVQGDRAAGATEQRVLDADTSLPLDALCLCLCLSTLQRIRRQERAGAERANRSRSPSSRRADDRIPRTPK